MPANIVNDVQTSGQFPQYGLLYDETEITDCTRNLGFHPHNNGLLSSVFHQLNFKTWGGILPIEFGYDDRKSTIKNLKPLMQ